MTMDLAQILLLLAGITFVLWILDELFLAPQRRWAAAQYVNKTGEAADPEVVKKLHSGPAWQVYPKYGLGLLWLLWLVRTVRQGDIDFGLVLLVLLAMAAGMALLDRLWFSRRRQAKLKEFEQFAGSSESEDVAYAVTREPLSTEYSVSFLPVLAVVFVLRSFVVEPFTIPSGSMLPTLQVSDYILVNKFAYGVRFPVFNAKLIEVGEPERGDVMVFKYPEKPTINYIKRVVGLPGDEILYQDKQLYINGEKMELEFVAKEPPARPTRILYRENLTGVEHMIQVDPFNDLFPGRWKVSENSYFVMGDNRDNSRDSRAWGFVPDELIVGKAFAIWMHWESWSIPEFSRNGMIQ